MSAEKIHYSVYPDLKLPETSCWHFIYESPSPPADDKVLYADALTDRQLTSVVFFKYLSLLCLLDSSRFGQLKSLTKRLAYGLVHRAKLTQDNVILVFSANNVLYPALVHSALAATLCITERAKIAIARPSRLFEYRLTLRQFANAAYQVDELIYQINDSRSKLIVVDKSLLEVAKQAAIKCGLTDRSIYLMEEEDYEQHKSIWSLAGREELEPSRLSSQEVKERTAFICYSSGTTGRAKGGTQHIISPVTRRFIGLATPSGVYSL
jgi:acyl-CoA synthetase (AMP-forming)/AMP-acid ligase II